MLYIYIYSKILSLFKLWTINYFKYILLKWVPIFIIILKDITVKVDKTIRTITILMLLNNIIKVQMEVIV